MSGKLLEAFRRSFSTPDVTTKLSRMLRQDIVAKELQGNRRRNPDARQTAATDLRQPRPRKYHRYYFACY
jgi:hypothetical protein